uniref:Uncharacterized protein n=1 Tax=Panagrolaimus sp. PS1159 TaxID=55785 RepID=A0AC35F2Z7_9BILA
MENLTSSINNDEEDQPLFVNNNDSGKSCEEYNILLDKLEKKTDDFMKVICTTKTVTVNGRNVQVKPLKSIAYKNLEAFITSADNIIKWYEADKSQSKATIGNHLNEVTVSNKAFKDMKQKTNDMQKTIAEQKDTITSTKTILDGEIKNAKDFEEKIQKMKIAQNEMQKKIVELEQKETDSNAYIKNLEVHVNDKNSLADTLKLGIDDKNNTIEYLKQHFEEVNRSFEAENVVYKQRIGELEKEKLKNEQALAGLEKEKPKIGQMQTRITKFTTETAKLIDPNQICIVYVSDIVVNGEVDYKKLNGKIMLIDELVYNNGNWSADGIQISFGFSNNFHVYVQRKLSVFSHSNLSNVLDRINCNNLKELHLFKTPLTFDDFKKLAASKELGCLKLNRVNVYDENGFKIGIGKLWKTAKYIKSVHYRFRDGEIMSGIAQKLAELQPFRNLNNVWLHNVEDDFNLEVFCEFIKKNPTVDCTLICNISEEFHDFLKWEQEELMPTLPSTSRLNISNIRYS